MQRIQKISLYDLLRVNAFPAVDLSTEHSNFQQNQERQFEELWLHIYNL